jgi:hypothetical protein
MKTEVYSWRLSADLKEALEAEARRRSVSVSALLDKIARQWIKEHEAERLKDETEQARIRAKVLKFAGALSIGGGPYTNEVVRKVITERLTQKYGRKLPR